MKFYCTRCRMSFRVEKKPRADTEKTLCAEDGCQVRFWHLTCWPGRASSVVGITPEDAAALQTTGEKAA